MEKIHPKTSDAPNDLKESIDPYIELLNKHNSKKIILHMPDFDQLPNEYLFCPYHQCNGINLLFLAFL